MTAAEQCGSRSRRRRRAGGAPAAGRPLLRGGVPTPRRDWERVVQAALLLCHIAVDLLGVVAPPVHVEDRCGYLSLFDCLVLVHIASTLSASRMLLTRGGKNGDALGATQAAPPPRTSRRGLRQKAD